MGSAKTNLVQHSWLLYGIMSNMWVWKCWDLIPSPPVERQWLRPYAAQKWIVTMLKLTKSIKVDNSLAFCFWKMGPKSGMVLPKKPQNPIHRIPAPPRVSPEIFLHPPDPPPRLPPPRPPRLPPWAPARPPARPRWPEGSPLLRLAPGGKMGCWYKKGSSFWVFHGVPQIGVQWI